MQRRHDAVASRAADGALGHDASLFPGLLPVVPPGAAPVIPDKDRRSNAATAASAAGMRALSAQALQFYFRAPAKAFFRTRVDYLAYARAADGSLTGSSSSSSSSSRFHRWLRGTTPGVLTLAIQRYGWSVVPEQILPPLAANVGVAAVLYTSYLHILGHLHPASGQARRRVYPPPAPTETFAAGFLAGSLQSLVAAPLDAIQARYDYAPSVATTTPGTTSTASTATPARPRSMWAFSYAKLREIGLRGIFAGWGLTLIKDSFGSAIFFSVFEYVKAQGYYRFVAYQYGALDGALILARQQQQQQGQAAHRGPPLPASAKEEHHHHLHHHHDGQDSFSPPSATAYAAADTPSSYPLVIRPHYALEPLFLLLAGITGSLAQQVLLHPLTHIQVVHWDLLEDLDAAAQAESRVAANGPAASASARLSALRPRFHVMRTYYHAYLETWRRCSSRAAAEGRSMVAWLYRGFWWNTIRQVPSTSAGLIIFELVRRKYGLAGEQVHISQDGYDIVLA